MMGGLRKGLQKGRCNTETLETRMASRLIFPVDKNLAVCGYAGITTRQEFSSLGFKAQLQCTDGFASWLNELIEVKCLPFDDGVPIPIDVLKMGIQWLCSHWDKGRRSLVSCAAGESRSVSMAIGLMTIKGEMPFAAACKLVFSRVPRAHPHPITLISVAKYCGCRLDHAQLRGI
jgi:hypothetical protein